MSDLLILALAPSALCLFASAVLFSLTLQQRRQTARLISDHLRRLEKWSVIQGGRSTSPDKRNPR